jgi:hypothetical protein
MDIGETLSECVVREVEEETGLDIEITGLLGIYIDPQHVIAYTDGEVRQEFNITYYGRIIGGTSQSATSPPTSASSTRLSSTESRSTTPSGSGFATMPNTATRPTSDSLAQTARRPSTSATVCPRCRHGCRQHHPTARSAAQPRGERPGERPALVDHSPCWS